MISAIARKRMLFLRVSIISLALLSYFFIEFRAFTLELSIEQSLQFSVIGFILLIFGCFGRIWASLYIEGNKTKNLITNGPFMMVRNPLYFFSLMILIGFCFALKSLFLPIGLILIFIVFHLPTIANEERKLRDIHGELFDDYVRSTPRLIPNIFKYKKPITSDRVNIKIKRINGVLLEVIGYIFTYTFIDLLYFILN
tara:strand:+ start:1948 stop:2541 length:594 start_codon:yes stop_codon:yes gene_type:complete